MDPVSMGKKHFCIEDVASKKLEQLSPDERALVHRVSLFYKPSFKLCHQKEETVMSSV